MLPYRVRSTSATKKAALEQARKSPSPSPCVPREGSWRDTHCSGGRSARGPQEDCGDTPRDNSGTMALSVMNNLQVTRPRCVKAKAASRCGGLSACSARTALGACSCGLCSVRLAPKIEKFGREYDPTTDTCLNLEGGGAPAAQSWLSTVQICSVWALCYNPLAQ